MKRRAVIFDYNDLIRFILWHLFSDDHKRGIEEAVHQCLIHTALLIALAKS
jgi:hypothetical protein